ncbi:tetratricopeptide repeat protein [bacterium]|nr:tetratricopeptide repeat protein [bacterium]
MAGLVRNKSFAADARRMLPVIGMVVGTAVVSAVSIQWLAVSHLAAATAAHPDACRIAEMNRAVAENLMPDIRAEALAKAKAASDPQALGRMKGDERVARVIQELSRALELCPARDQLHDAIAVAYWYDGNVAMTHYHLGRGALLRKKPKEAVVQLTLAREADATSDLPLIYLALARKESGDQDGAAALVRDNTPRFEKSADGLIVAGRIIADTGDSSRAIQLLQNGLLLRPSDEDGVGRLTDLGTRTNRFRETADFLLSLDSDGRRTVPSALANAASLYRRAGNLEGEEDALRRALRLFPNSAVLNFELAVNLSKTNRRSEARDYLRRAMEYSRPITMQLIRERGIDPSL